MTTWTSEYFCGNKISDYGLEHNRVDYKTLASAFEAILNNNIMQAAASIGEWELVNGSDYNEETEEWVETFQSYIVSDQGAQILQEYTDEILYYNSELDMYVWCVDHYGTAWDYVLTDIEVKLDK